MVAASEALPSDTYVPIVKGKAAEYGAIGSCTSERLVPLVEVKVPAAAAPALAKAWPRDDVIWIHSLNFDDDEEASFAGDIDDLFRALRGTTAAVPVITVTEGPDTLTAMARIHAEDGRGVVIRIEAEDILDQATDTAADVTSTLEQIALSPESVDVVVDCGLVAGTATVKSAVAGQSLRQLPHMNRWRSVAVAFSAFPAALADVVPKGAVRAIPREDAEAFVQARQLVDRTLVFADYTVGVPTYADIPFAPIPNIRYAHDGDWIVHRGHQRRDPSTQYRGLASAVIAAPYFAGPSFSPGDRQIHDVATGASGPGNATTHLRVGVSRHLHVVLERLATHDAP